MSNYNLIWTIENIDMKIFITGATGFFGSELAARLLNLKHELFFIDETSVKS